MDLNALVRDVLPEQPLNMREERFRGDAFDLDQEALSPREREAVRDLYDRLAAVYSRWLDLRDRPHAERSGLRPHVVALDDPMLREAARFLGQDTRADRPLRVAQVLHDVRGGALTALLVYAHLLRNADDPILLRSAVLLARDHAKMMRNALPWIDPQGRARDEEDRPHQVVDVVRKWDGFRFPAGSIGTDGRVHVEGLRSGLLAARCLEASAIDRILYNLMNNAMRFASAPQVRLAIHRVEPLLVRWIVANPISVNQAKWISERTAGEPSRLFLGGITSGGSGIGLANCTDFVVSAFGLPDVESAVEGGHAGALLARGHFLGWFHWPALKVSAAGRAAL